MSSGELNKIFAAVLLAGLIAMMSGFIAGKLVHPHIPEQAAYRVEIPDAPSAAPAQEAPPALDPVGPLLASADVEAGQRQFRACASCHTVDRGGPSRVGPNLWGVVGGPHAHIQGFAYSDALAAMHDKPWDYEELNAFFANPRAYAPGTKMNFNGIRSAQDRANLIAWLRTQHDSPPPLPE
jgi:cytochrome c